jgi:hypothetical protein
MPPARLLVDALGGPIRSPASESKGCALPNTWKDRASDVGTDQDRERYRVKVDSAHWRGEIRPSASGLDLIRPHVPSKPRWLHPEGELLVKRQDLGPPNGCAGLIHPPCHSLRPFGPRETSAAGRRQMAPDGTATKLLRLESLVVPSSYVFARRQFGHLPVPQRRTKDESDALNQPGPSLLRRSAQAISCCFSPLLILLQF